MLTVTPTEHTITFVLRGGIFLGTVVEDEEGRLYKVTRLDLEAERGTAVALTPPEDDAEWIARAEAEQREYERLVASGEIQTKAARCRGEAVSDRDENYHGRDLLDRIAALEGENDRLRDAAELCARCTPERDHNGVLCRKCANAENAKWLAWSGGRYPAAEEKP